MKYFLTSLAILAGASSASAATVTETIDLFGSGGLARSYDNFGDSVGLEVTAYANSNGVLGAARNVGRWRTGLGVQQIGTNENHQLDGGGADETLVFTFGRKVTLTGATFSYYSSRDDFDLSFFSPNGGGLPMLNTFLENQAIAPFSTTDGRYDNEGGDVGQALFSGKQLAMGSIFGIGANHSSDSFKVQSITISYEQINEVPLPAAGWMLLAGLGGIAAMRRQKKT